MNLALIPAAGFSKRMGTPKLALSLGSRCVLERVIDALRESKHDAILVVLGPHVADLAVKATAAGGVALVLDEATSSMRATIMAGLNAMESRWRPDAGDWLTLVPADHPLLNSHVVEQMRLGASRRSDAGIVVPTHAGRRGHPVLISWRFVPGLSEFPADRGVNEYLRQFPGETLETPVDSPDILLDLDTPEDFNAVSKRFKLLPSGTVPAREPA